MDNLNLKVEGMAYIYMDESGDLGFNKEKINSDFFMITFLISQNEKEVESIMKNVYKWMSGKKVKRKDYFHSNKELRSSVKRALDLASRREINAVSIVLDKANFSWKEKKDTHLLYNKLVSALLQQCEKRGYINSREPLYFVASRKETKKELNIQFIDCVEKSVSDLIDIKVKIAHAGSSRGLELVDAISFAIYQKYEKQDLELYAIIKNKILLEKIFE